MITESRSTHLRFDLGGDGLNFFPAVFLEFDDQDGARITLYEKAVLTLFDVVLGAFQYIMIDELAGRRVMRHSDEICPERFVDGIEMDAKQSRLPGRQR